MNAMNGDFVTALASEVRKPVVETVNGVQRLLLPDGIDGGYRLAETLPSQALLPKTVALGTLAGLATYIQENRDKLTREELIAHVVGPALVELKGVPTGDFRDRPVYAAADLKNLIGLNAFPFGNFLDSETFVIALQSLFVENDQLKEVLSVVGNIKEEAVRNTSDDGISQKVVASAGAVTVKELTVPNPVTLAPYRTFREVAQPESRFILRLRSGGAEGEKPKCALFEADGASWKLEAVARVAAWLKEKLAGTSVVVVA